MKIKIKEELYDIILEDNRTTAALLEMLPLVLDMAELNGNEKYCYLKQSLPVGAEYIGRINAGDIMLFGNNCLVLFYKNFNTSYSYTRIGRVNNPENIGKLLGKGRVTVTLNNN